MAVVTFIPDRAIGGRCYVDGEARSATSLSALSGTDVHDIYVLAPMASTEPLHQPFHLGGK